MPVSRTLFQTCKESLANILLAINELQQEFNMLPGGPQREEHRMKREWQGRARRCNIHIHTGNKRDLISWLLYTLLENDLVCNWFES